MPPNLFGDDLLPLGPNEAWQGRGSGRVRDKFLMQLSISRHKVQALTEREQFLPPPSISVEERVNHPHSWQVCNACRKEKFTSKSVPCTALQRINIDCGEWEWGWNGRRNQWAWFPPDRFVLPEKHRIYMCNGCHQTICHECRHELTTFAPEAAWCHSCYNSAQRTLTEICEADGFQMFFRSSNRWWQDEFWEDEFGRLNVEPFSKGSDPFKKIRFCRACNQDEHLMFTHLAVDHAIGLRGGATPCVSLSVDARLALSRACAVHQKQHFIHIVYAKKDKQAEHFRHLWSPEHKSALIAGDHGFKLEQHGIKGWNQGRFEWYSESLHEIVANRVALKETCWATVKVEDIPQDLRRLACKRHMTLLQQHTFELELRKFFKENVKREEPLYDARLF
jgi:hypothetical protein